MSNWMHLAEQIGVFVTVIVCWRTSPTSARIKVVALGKTHSEVAFKEGICIVVVFRWMLRICTRLCASRGMSGGDAIVQSSTGVSEPIVRHNGCRASSIYPWLQQLPHNKFPHLLSPASYPFNENKRSMTVYFAKWRADAGLLLQTLFDCNNKTCQVASSSLLNP